MKIGESKDLAIEPADAYGEEVVIQDFARWQLDDFFADEEPEVGQTFEANGFSVTILSVDEETVKLQYPNPHHLAGERLNFEVELLAINPECGDGKKEHDAVEMCDDGNTENGDGCDKKCALEE